MPVSPTKAYSRFKNQSQALLDFTVLVAYAVPALREDIDLVKSGRQKALLAPDFFHRSNRSSADDMEQKESGYEQHLAATLLLTHFSFFEAFVTDVILEIFDFHGGEKQFLARIRRRTNRFLAPHPPALAQLKRKLQDSEKPGWQDRYRKYAAKLASEGYRFPGELLAAFGVQNLILKLKRLKSFEIPGLLVNALGMNLSNAEVSRYERIRELRNGIAHGRSQPLSIRDSIQMNKELRELAIRISAHMTENFFVIEKYAP